MKSDVADLFFKQSAWANQKFFSQLSELPEDALNYSGWNKDWTVGKLANHIVFAQGRTVARATGESIGDETEAPLTSAGMLQLAKKSADIYSQIFALLDGANEVMHFSRMGVDVQFSRATILAQVVHHSTEHRTQISDILAMNGMDVINLDSLDFWTFEHDSRH